MNLNNTVRIIISVFVVDIVCLKNEKNKCWTKKQILSFYGKAEITCFAS